MDLEVVSNSVFVAWATNCTHKLAPGSRTNLVSDNGCHKRLSSDVKACCLVDKRYLAVSRSPLGIYILFFKTVLRLIDPVTADSVDSVGALFQLGDKLGGTMVRVGVGIFARDTSNVRHFSVRLNKNIASKLLGYQKRS